LNRIMPTEAEIFACVHREKGNRLLSPKTLSNVSV
jgi:hypothetical protein